MLPIEIRINNNRPLPDAIADSVKLMLGDILEEKDDIPMSTTFDMMAKDNNFHYFVRNIMKILLFAKSIAETSEELYAFTEADINNIVLDDLFVAEVFFILGDLTRSDLIACKKDIIAISMKEDPKKVYRR
jgi:hypothetical protein